MTKIEKEELELQVKILIVAVDRQSGQALERSIFSTKITSTILASTTSLLLLVETISETEQHLPRPPLKIECRIEIISIRFAPILAGIEDISHTDSESPIFLQHITAEANIHKKVRISISLGGLLRCPIIKAHLKIGFLSDGHHRVDPAHPAIGIRFEFLSQISTVGY